MKLCTSPWLVLLYGRYWQPVMSDTSDLAVRVLDDRDIVVVGTGFEVTYRKDGQLPMLVATDHLRGGLSSAKAKFLAQAWKVAYHKAKTLGWLVR